jgi:anti-sigma B factor antagonist
MDIEKYSQWLRIELSGDIDLAWHEDHREAIDRALTDCPPTVLIDLEHVDFMDSTGLSLIVQAYRARADRTGEIIVLNACPFVLRTLEVAGLDQLVTVVSTCEEARKVYDRLAHLTALEIA